MVTTKTRLAHVVEGVFPNGGASETAFAGGVLYSYRGFMRRWIFAQVAAVRDGYPILRVCTAAQTYQRNLLCLVIPPLWSRLYFANDENGVKLSGPPIRYKIV